MSTPSIPLGGNPRGAEAPLLHRISAATGLRFGNDGHTTEPPSRERASFQPDRYGDRWAPVLFVWATADEQPDFGVDFAGLGGSVRYGWGEHPGVYVTGMVQLDSTKHGPGERPTTS